MVKIRASGKKMTCDMYNIWSQILFLSSLHWYFSPSLLSVFSLTLKISDLSKCNFVVSVIIYVDLSKCKFETVKSHCILHINEVLYQLQPQAIYCSAALNRLFHITRACLLTYFTRKLFTEILVLLT